MIKRLFWVSAGFGLGVAATRKAQQATANLAPDNVATRLRGRWDAAVGEGRDEMMRREFALREVLAAPGQDPHRTRPASSSRRSGRGGR